MANMSWKKAILKVLRDSDSAMHYADIAEKIVEDGLRDKVGATPASTVNVIISSSIKEERKESPFIRVGRGEYFLRAKSDEPQEKAPATTPEGEIEEDAEDHAIIQAFGMFWQRELVLWTGNPNILGKQQVGADSVDFSNQVGVYLLHDGREVVYVGRPVDRPLGKRLYEHTQDRLRGRWNRFSWFGLLMVTDDGKLKEAPLKPTITTIISSMEALLIEGLEPPQNRKRGDDFTAIEYLQAEDPEIEKQQMQALLAEMQKKLSQ